MKRLAALMVIMVLGLSLTACDNASTGNTTEKSEQIEKQAVESPAAENSDVESFAMQQAEDTSKKEETKNGEQSKILVAYFSWAENAMQGEDMDAMTSPSVTEPGNVAQLASWVSGETGGDLFSIQVKEPYPADWDGCLERANQEKKDNTHPALKIFCSHGTGGLAGSVKNISAAIPDAEIADNVFDVYEEDTASAKNEIVEWVKTTKEN